MSETERGSFETRASTATRSRGASRNGAILVTGAGGEMGHGLLAALAAERESRRERGESSPAIVAIDLRDLPSAHRDLCDEAFTGDVCDAQLLERMLSSFEVGEIYHLAALLSTRSEFVPETAHAVNVGGTLNLLRLAAEEARTHGSPVRFFFPSSIAAYGLPDLATKEAAGAVGEDEFLQPHTMYGCNKVSGENLGFYYENHYRKLASDRIDAPIDFRSIRFPGIISADTVPSGGTSDYGPEMLHAAARRDPYACFVRPDARIPFMTMPEAVEAIRRLMSVEKSTLSRNVYNIQSFHPSAEEFLDAVRGHFPDADTTFDPDLARQAIIDSWPEACDDRAARADWGWAPTYDLFGAFESYLVPRIRARYADA
ncbi:MAG: GDP-mannose 4,6-dehydratase [Planctomycetota bacterium]|nr:GDP-mannose 4,6-dehydratase [Planctomycetota bacterium]